MTMTLISLALCAAVAALVAAPLFRRSANLPLGTGIEDDGPVRRWRDEKDRLITQLRDNDLALAEGRIDAGVHTTIASRLAHDAETALARLREAREALAPGPVHEPSWIGRWPTFFAGLAVIALAWGAHVVSSRSDIDMTRSPHAADGSIPLPADAGGMPVDADGAPDIGAMVTRLEARIEGGDYTPQDVSMLLRSYRVLGREEEAAALLARARQAHPDDVGLMLSQAELLIGDPRPESVDEAETVIAAALAAEPGLPEALWYRSLLLVRQGRIDAARAELDRLAPRVAGNPQAVEAIRSLRARIELPPDHPAPTDR